VAERFCDLSLRLSVEQGGTEAKQNLAEPRVVIDRLCFRDELIQSPSDCILDVTGRSLARRRFFRDRA
ncbi:hypothetical protein ACTXGK_14585, partial [Psychrobacter sp. T6-5]|uniref:hypothetical protein n=1 Tax=Psychrobacter sp. T6-5 TaxID=3457451 RepID=UPI003FCF2972